MDDQVAKQVNNLLSFFPNQVRLAKPNGPMELPLVVGPTRAPITLVVSLPDGFPNTAPVVRVFPAVAQRWVDSEMRVVGHEALATWNRNMSLGKIVKDIEIEFNLRPPTIIAVPGAFSNMVPGPGSAMAAPPVQPTATASPSERTLRTNVEFDKVDELSLKTIKQILEGEERFEEFFLSCQAVKEAKSFQDELVRSNYEMARRNLDLQEEVKGAQDRMEELDAILELEEAEVRRVYEANKETLKRYSEEHILTSLMDRTKEVDRASQKLTASLANEESDMDVARFLIAYRKVRQSLHQQTACLEKFKQLMSRC